MISFFDIPAIDALVRELRFDPQQLRKARIAYFKKSLGIDAALDCLPPEHRRAFAEQVTFNPLSEATRCESDLDGATKIVTRTELGFSIESVILRPTTGRIALCISSQVGCAAACAFCSTGHMGVARDLTTAEIVGQVVHTNELLRQEGRRVRNIVFMGMGEPMHNETNLHDALSVLQNPATFDHPASRMLVSTVGVPDPLLRTAKRFPRTNFALSLHATTDEVRQQIIPLAKRYSLEHLRETIVELNAIQPEKVSVMIEYLMLDGLNDSLDDAQRLARWVEDLRVHLNLIPFNPIPQEPQLRSSPRSTIEAFGAVLREAGHPTTIRRSLGSDIAAACGQLVREENRQLAQQLSTGNA